ncbi:MAG: HNH endonuclease [Anaerolineaceae bacterium]|nr:HNH endonuclease [Anaerolineaceae bacterium]
MTKSRTPIPRKIRDQVLKEFNHRCAICGADQPHIHHIDENPSNNDPENLIPLCPNCHLIDQHNPTEGVEVEKLKLFRKYKDPTILKHQFHPLFLRTDFLNKISDDSDAKELDKQAEELTDFVKELEMGSFYAKKLSQLIRKPKYGGVIALGDPHSRHRYLQQQKKQDQDYRLQLREAYDQVMSLVVELLRFQSW